MRRDEMRRRARALLDRARDGQPVSSLAITRALIVGGDLCSDSLAQARRRADTIPLHSRAERIEQKEE